MAVPARRDDSCFVAVTRTGRRVAAPLFTVTIAAPAGSVPQWLLTVIIHSARVYAEFLFARTATFCAALTSLVL